MIEIEDAKTVKNDDKLSVGIVGEVTPNTISVDYRPPNTAFIYITLAASTLTRI